VAEAMLSATGAAGHPAALVAAGAHAAQQHLKQRRASGPLFAPECKGSTDRAKAAHQVIHILWVQSVQAAQQPFVALERELRHHVP